MILSVSRRTDIPAFYAAWFMNRIHDGYVLVRNPMNYHQVSKVNLSPDVIDCIVFWTKNAAPILPYLNEIESRFPFYFQYTLNAYDNAIEPGVPSAEKRLASFLQLSDVVGPERVIWRYDPILLSNKYTIDWHAEQFRQMAKAISGHSKTCVVSFIDFYDKILKTLTAIGVSECTNEEIRALAQRLSETAGYYGIQIQTCAEKADLQEFGITHSSCIDANVISRITGWNIKAKKDPNQRIECGCIESIDIGQYNTCKHGCKYCYATFNPQAVQTLTQKHDPASPFLIGNQEPGDKITERKMKSLKNGPAGQLSMI